ncbi:hypothetical protein BOX15_Mlig030395g1 [Macrostomum lignano]|uniref:BZIP domain-containing protein n=2 Tax=Macrostomum lignano TaxID=282301 RepID=A0A1I8FZ17_9PLAT|nr:hypothetical protein BOX15_Mlig030395g1 [Macrostomum lignano]
MSSVQAKPAVAQSSATITVSTAGGSATASLRNLKGSMTLPLQSSVNVGNSIAHIRGLTPLAQLNSPDLKNLTSTGVTPFLTSPDFDKLVSQSLGITPTSASGNAPQTPTTFLNPKFVTEEQERFVMNFDEKIKSMIKKEREGDDENQLNTPVIMDISGPGYVISSVATSMDTSGQAVVTVGQQTASMFSAAAAPIPTSIVTVSSALSRPQLPPPQPASIAASTIAGGSYTTEDDSGEEPMDDVVSSVGSTSRRLGLGDQEQLKLERKRQRNRDAARKCRERKLERIRFLEERVAELKSQNSRLQRTAVDLREQVKTLQHVIVEHTKRGCSLKDSLGSKLGGLA